MINIDETTKAINESVKMRNDLFPTAKITSYLQNFRHRYHNDLRPILRAILDYCNIFQVQTSDDAADQGCKITYAAPLYTGLGTSKDDREEKYKLIKDLLEVNCDPYSIPEILKSGGIPPWNIVAIQERLEIKHEIPDLISCLCLDLAYEIILKFKDKQLFGKEPLENCIFYMKEATKDFKYMANDKKSKNLLNLKKHPDEDDLIRKIPLPVERYLKKHPEERESYYSELSFEKLPETAQSRVPIIFDYYFQDLNYLWHPSDKVAKILTKDGHRTEKKAANKRNIKINKEYLPLYSQMPFIYLADWLKTYEKKLSYSEDLPVYSTLSCFETEKYIFDATSFKNYPSCYPTSEKTSSNPNSPSITKDAVLNPDKAYNLNKKVGKRETRQYLYMILANITSAIASYNKHFTEYNRNAYRLKNIQEEKLTPTEERFLLDIFRVEFLLRNSICMRAFHHDLINRLYRSVYNKELPPEEFLRFRPSLYSTSLALYLLETSTVINKDDLKAFDIYSGNISDKVSTFSLEDEDSDGLNNCILALRKLLLNSFNHTYSSEVSIHDLCATHLLTHITNKASHYLKASYGVGEDILKDDKLLWKNLEEMINNFQSYGKKLKETEF